MAAQRRDPFRVLIACLLSLRTKDETTGPAAARLFALADTPEAMLRLTPRRIEREAMDMQLQGKLLQYKREMGLLPAATDESSPQALPAQGETGS